jgi:hypothetical protein
MTTVILNQEEVKLIQQILDMTLEDLRTEIYHTDRLEYKDDLKANETKLHTLIDKLHPLTLAEELKIEMT